MSKPIKLCEDLLINPKYIKAVKCDSDTRSCTIYMKGNNDGSTWLFNNKIRPKCYEETKKAFFG